MEDLNINSEYCQKRGLDKVKYRGEVFYTITDIPLYISRRNELLRLLKKIILRVKPRVFLDYGCGDGWYLRFLASILPRTSAFIGVDISSNMIKRAELICHGYTNISLSMDIEKAVSDGLVDFTIVIAVMAHVPKENHFSIAQLLYRKLVKGGILCIFEQTGNIESSGKQWYRYRPEYYERLFGTVGFKKLESQLIAFPFYNLIISWVKNVISRLPFFGASAGTITEYF